MPDTPAPPDGGAARTAETHLVFNVGRELADYNAYLADAALQEAVAREGAGAAHQDLVAFGELTGRADTLELGALANRYPPEFDSHDRFGHRIDLVRFYPAYHELMTSAIEHGLHASPWTHPGPGAHVARAARYYLQAQVQAGHGCPITMTYAALPAASCARAGTGVGAEAMECIGGSGVMEDSPMPRLFRESPVNAIWEGSGNIQCLDVLPRDAEVTCCSGGALRRARPRAWCRCAPVDRTVDELHAELRNADQIEFRARCIVERMALAAQGALLLQHAPGYVADAFCASPLGKSGHHQFGTLPSGVDAGAITERAMPVSS